MPDSTRISSAWRTAHSRGIAPGPVHASRSAPGYEEDPRMAPQPTAWLSFRDFAAIQIAAAMKGTTRDLSPSETAEVAFDIAVALEDERARRDQASDAPCRRSGSDPQ